MFLIRRADEEDGTQLHQRVDTSCTKSGHFYMRALTRVVDPDPHPHQSDKMDPEPDTDPHRFPDDKPKPME